MAMPGQLVYFADPMCSWCWGFSPVIEAARNRFGDELPVRLILGGLRPGTTEVMDDAAKRMIREHWDHVHAASGQPFEFAFFEREGFVYDTGPACRAAVAVRRQDPEKALAFLKHLHQAFYTENRDVTDRETLCALASELGLDRERFAESFDAEETLQETKRDFAISRRAGVTGFPTLLAGSDAEGYAIVTVGYQPWEKVEALIAAWLEQRREQARSAAPNADQT
jgi:putative protein-disulfide isomerase